MPTRLALLFLLLTLSIHSSAQHEWSEVYRSSAAYYQQRNLSEAFQEATQALVNVRASQGINSAQYAEGLQLLTLTAAAGGPLRPSLGLRPATNQGIPTAVPASHYPLPASPATNGFATLATRS